MVFAPGRDPCAAMRYWARSRASDAATGISAKPDLGLLACHYGSAAAASRIMLRLGMDVSIALVPLAAIIVLLSDLGMPAERWLWIGAIALICIAALAMIYNARSSHFEGFVLLVSLTLTFQGILTLLSLGKEFSGSRPTPLGTGGTK
jgi:hypothetical protein